MAVGTFYWVPRFGGWNGSTANTGTDSAPFLGSYEVRLAMASGAISPGSRIIFMGEYGVVGLAELTAADTWGQDAKTITQALNSLLGASSLSMTAAAKEGGILWGNSHNSTSHCRDMTFVFRGPYQWHVDARGATTNAQRMRAAITIQGSRNRVEDLRLAQPDWNPMDNVRGVGQGIAATSIFAQECSEENYGLMFFGGWGCQAVNCDVWGSNAFGRTGIEIKLSMLNTTDQPNSETYIDGCDTWGNDRGQYIQIASGLVNGGLSFPDRWTPAGGATVEIRNGRAWNARWGDTTTAGDVNNSMFHGNHVSFGAGIWLRGRARIHHMETWGNVQDSIELVTGYAEVSDSYIHDLNPTYAPGATFDRWVNSGGTWVTSANGVIGEGIKLGLGGSEGLMNAASWPSSGTNEGAWNIPAARSRALRNRIETSTPQNDSAGITTNGSNGALVCANEIRGFGVGIKASAVGAGTVGDEMQHWISNNYAEATNIALQVFGKTGVWLWNNILKGTNFDLNGASATSGYYRGGRNRLVNNLSALGSLVNEMQGNTTGAADYVFGIGPTAAGNCVVAGSMQGQYGACAAGALLGIDGYPLGRVVGPRRAT